MTPDPNFADRLRTMADQRPPEEQATLARALRLAADLLDLADATLETVLNDPDFCRDHPATARIARNIRNRIEGW